MNTRKVIYSILTGILCIIPTHFIFKQAVSDRSDFATWDAKSVAYDLFNSRKYQSLLGEWNWGINSPKPELPKWNDLSDPNLLAMANQVVTRSQEIKAMSKTNLFFRSFLLYIASIIIGFIAFYVAYPIATALSFFTAKPLNVVLSSDMENFVNFILGPCMIAIFIGVGISAGAVAFMIRPYASVFLSFP